MSRLLFSALRWVALMALALAASGEAAAQHPAEKRVALVIGMGDYASARKLRNPISDARAVETALKSLGFKVVVETDRNNRRLSAALDEFVEENKGADLALVFFAGHGVQVGGRNYLLPTDAKTGSATALEASSLPLERVFARVAEIAPKRIILLDACRNDPFGTAAVAGGRGGGAIIEKDSDNAPKAKASMGAIQFGLGRIGRADGTVYGFATAPGTTASDGDGANSPFTAALAAHLGQAGLEFGSVMKLVQMEVYERTRGRQLPYIEDALPALVFADTKGEPLAERDRLLLAMAKIDADTRTQVERIAATNDVPLAPLYGALLAGAAKAGPGEADAREKRLARAAEDFVKVRNDIKTLKSSDPDVTALRKQAEQQLSLGAFDAARVALTKAIEVDHNSGERLEVRLKERNFSEAASYATRAGVAVTLLNYRAAAVDLGIAADLVERWDKRIAWLYVLYQGIDLDSQGDEFGDNNAIAEAISAYGRALTLASRREHPEDWLDTQRHLAQSLTRLGERESGTARLEEALSIFRAILLEQKRERTPEAWARTQTGLGVVLQDLGDREGGTERLEESAAAFEAALSASPRERHPLDWAIAKGNVGGALYRLGLRKQGVAQLEQSVAAYRAALSELTRETDPLSWATMQSNIASALMELGIRENSAARLEEAVTAYRAALLENTRERVPLAWANTQAGLGSALASLGERENNMGRVKEAVTAYNAAMLELSRDRDPIEWARICNELGNSLRELGKREDGTSKLKDAVLAYRAALDEFTPESWPLRWATAQNNLGDTLLILYGREKDVANLAEAIVSFRAVLEEIATGRIQVKSADIQSRLDQARHQLDEAGKMGRAAR